MIKGLPARKEFDLRLWFVAISIAAIVVINTLSAFLLSRYVSQSFIDREGEVAREFLNSIISAEQSGLHLFEAPAPSPALQSFSSHVRNLPGVVRANIYAPDYFIRFSTNPNLVGLRFADNQELVEAFEGKLIANLEEVEETAKAEHIALDLDGNVELIEAYIPVSGNDGEVVAVVEFYSRPDALKAIISNVSLSIWASAAVAGALLFAALYGAVARGSTIINRQKREIGDMAALAALGQMAGAVAHSLRNPLAGIQSTAELMRLQFGLQAEEPVTDILGEVERMNQHVHELLDYARSEGGSGQRVNLSHFMRRLLAKNEAHLAKRSVSLSLHVKEAATAEVEVDPMMFNQALASIVSNAAEAMPNGGCIFVTLRPATQRGMVELSIRDTGQGISPDVLARLPSPFVTTKTRGLGLGLTLALRIVERSGGTLALNSKLGEGTTVTLLFPVVSSI